MSGSGWLGSGWFGGGRFRGVVPALACAATLVAAAGPAVAGGRNHHDGWRDHGYRHHHFGYRHGHHHGGSGISGLFVWDLGPSPPRRVVAAPPPMIVEPPPIHMRAPPPVYCREYSSTAIVDGRPVETWGTACLQPDGSWRIVGVN